MCCVLLALVTFVDVSSSYGKGFGSPNRPSWWIFMLIYRPPRATGRLVILHWYHLDNYIKIFTEIFSPRYNWQWASLGHNELTDLQVSKTVNVYLLQIIWIMGTLRWTLPVSNFQMSCSDLTLNMLNCFKDYKRWIHISYHIMECVQQKKIRFTMLQPYKLHILYCQYHACWCTGALRSQGISRHGIDPCSQNILSAASEELRYADWQDFCPRNDHQ